MYRITIEVEATVFDQQGTDAEWIEHVLEKAGVDVDMIDVDITEEVAFE